MRSPFLCEGRCSGWIRSSKLYPGVKEEYLERAFEKLKKNGCPAGEDLMVWFGKLVAAEILEDALGNGKHDEND